ncbi:MAG: nucleotide exchange factor GrpE [Candidatus Thermoplasmatota archaeon]|nr:nucleotide exchange factor GrpE [Candidatus Thermoplasmatota archaeon]
MIFDTIDDELKANIWRRDEFTCGLCGKMVPWPEVAIIPRKNSKKGERLGPDDLMTACVYCVEETKGFGAGDKDKRRLKRLLRELMEYTDHSDIIFEEDYEEEVIKLSGKIETMKKEYNLLSDAYQQKEKLAIAYKVKMDRVLKDLENYKSRAKNDIELNVKIRTKSLFLELIQTLDNLDRALEETQKEDKIKEVKNLRKGLISIRKGIIRSLEDNGVTLLDPLEEPFDPREHESIASVEDKERSSETVIKVQNLGFKMGDMMIRPAKVVITKGGPKRERKEKFDEFDLDLGKTVNELEEIEEPDEILEMGSYEEGEVEIEVVPKKKRKKITS